MPDFSPGDDEAAFIDSTLSRRGTVGDFDCMVVDGGTGVSGGIGMGEGGGWAIDDDPSGRFGGCTVWASRLPICPLLT